ncbi:MAG: FtsX-like permease family protein [Steroidobacteraceae bacterium]|jgi:putative ABC transport system permease protein|nr:FtsX-like permease family protein [Steroidobacteraceae bacterium]
MRAVQLAMRMLGREWKSGELGVLLLALTVAVSALTGVGFLVNRISQAVDLQATEVLAADLRLESPSPLDERYLAAAARARLVTARTTSVLSVVFREEASQLSNVRAVSASYPLRGRVTVAAEAFGIGQPVAGGPKPGEAWPDSKLVAALGARLGDELSIGAGTFRITQVLITRPDQGGTFSDLAPSILINDADLAATRLIGPGSRARFALLFAGERRQVEAFKARLEGMKQRGERLLDVTEASPQIKNALDRAGRFLSLASLVAVLLCSIAVAMAARRYVQRHLDSVALMKTLGASRNLTLAVSLLQLLAVGVGAAMLGSAIGFGAHEWLLRALKDLLQAQLPPPDLAPIGLGFLTAIAVLAGFALPPLLQLSRVPAIRVLRRDVGPPPPLVWLAFGPAIAAVVFLIWWVTRDLLIFSGFVGGLAAFVLLLAVAGFVLVRAASGLRGTVGVSWRYGIANLSRRRGESVIQIVAFGLGIMVLLLLAVVRNDLLADWRRSLPEDLPNFFFINIPPADREPFVAFLQESGARTSRALPMIRARLTQLNGRDIENIEFSSPRGEGFARREQNITWQEDLGDDNRVVAGRWWTPEDRGKALVSVSTEVQEGLGLVVGDRLTFDVAGESYEATVASVRKVKWDSFQPNFFLVFAPGLLDDTVGTWMTSAYFKPQQGRTIADLVRRFPSVSVFDLDELLTQVRSVIEKAILAVQSVFLFTLCAGLVVLLAAVQATRDERRYESAMLRTLGASRATVARGVLAEFTMLGLLSGLLAAGGASVAGWLLARYVLEIEYGFDASVWLIGLVGGAVLVAVAGWLATRSVVRQPPVATLRAN